MTYRTIEASWEWPIGHQIALRRRAVEAAKQLGEIDGFDPVVLRIGDTTRTRSRSGNTSCYPQNRWSGGTSRQSPGTAIWIEHSPRCALSPWLGVGGTLDGHSCAKAEL